MDSCRQLQRGRSSCERWQELSQGCRPPRGPRPGAVRVSWAAGGEEPCSCGSDPFAARPSPARPLCHPHPPRDAPRMSPAVTPGCCSPGASAAVGAKPAGGAGGPGGRGAVPRRRWPSAGGGLPLEVPGQHCPAEGQSQPPRVIAAGSPRGCRTRRRWMEEKQPPPERWPGGLGDNGEASSSCPSCRAGGDESHQRGLGAATSSFRAPSFSFRR